MKYFYLLAFFITGILYSQNDSASNKPFGFFANDSVNGFSEHEFTFAGAENRFLLSDSLIYFDSPDSVKSFVKRKNAIGPFNPDKINFNDSALILAAYHGVDCHSKFDIRLTDNPDLKEYVFKVKVIYGGCRSGGKRFVHWLKIPRLPEGYTIRYQWYYVDDVPWW